MLCATQPAISEDVANFRKGFGGDGWSYLWNAPAHWDAQSGVADAATGKIGDPAHYRRLAATGKDRVYTPHGAIGASPEPAGFLKINPYGGHPGRGSAQRMDVGNKQSRYVIVAYEVSADGTYAIRNSSLHEAAPGIHVLIHVNGDTPLLDKISKVSGDETDGFDADLGPLKKGDTVYVALGPGKYDTDGYFKINFDIATVDEPS